LAKGNISILLLPFQPFHQNLYEANSFNPIAMDIHLPDILFFT